MPDPNDAVAIDLAIEHAAADEPELREKALRVLERRRRRGFNPRDRVVLVTHDDVAPTREVGTEIVVPRIVVAIPVRDHHQRARRECGDRCGVIDALKLHRVGDISVVHVVRRDRGRRVGSSCREVFHVPEARFVPGSVDDVASRERAVAVCVDDEIEAAAGTVARTSRDPGHQQAHHGSRRSRRNDQRLRSAADIGEGGVRGPLCCRSVVDHNEVNSRTHEVRKADRINRRAHRPTEVKAVEMKRPRRCRGCNTGDFSDNRSNGRARPPRAEEYREILAIHRTGAVEIGGWVVGTPTAQDRRKITAGNVATPINIAHASARER